MNARSDTTGRPFYGWKLVGALWWLDLLNMGLPLYCSSVINSYMLQRIPMERSTFGLGYTLVNFFVGVPSALIALVILRRGVRATLVLGAGLICLGSLWMALVAAAPWHYLVGFGVIIGSGVGFGTVMPISTAITRWFARYRGRALAIALTAWGVAGFAGAPLFNRLLERNGGNFRIAWLIIAGASALSAAIAYFFIVERPEDLGQAPDGNSVESPMESHLAAQEDAPVKVA
ncbi:MAG TPA: MFS transporter, partial [Candidatus Acidoferrales bacterium]|nr:MFS transporter [Candidatus Acidoferrales bacterium]